MLDGPNQPPQPKGLPRFQFSLRWLLIGVTVVALFLGLTSLLGEGLFELIFVAAIFCILPTPLVVVTIFGHGELRTFAIGGLVPWLWFWVNGEPFSQLSIIETLIIGTWLPATGAVCGVIAMTTHRWLVERGGI